MTNVLQSMNRKQNSRGVLRNSSKEQQKLGLSTEALKIKIRKKDAEDDYEPDSLRVSYFY